MKQAAKTKVWRVLFNFHALIHSKSLNQCMYLGSNAECCSLWILGFRKSQVQSGSLMAYSLSACNILFKYRINSVFTIILLIEWVEQRTCFLNVQSVRPSDLWTEMEVGEHVGTGCQWGDEVLRGWGQAEGRGVLGSVHVWHHFQSNKAHLWFWSRSLFFLFC